MKSKIIILLFVLFFSPLALGATFTVTTTTDDALNGSSCTLRKAIINLNNGTDTYADCSHTGNYGTADTITLTGGATYVLSIADSINIDNFYVDEDSSATGDFDIRVPMTIQSSSSTKAIVSLDAGYVNSNGQTRLFEVLSGNSVSTIFDHITLQNGNVDLLYGDGDCEQTEGRGSGGALCVRGSTVTLTTSEIKNSVAALYGAGIYAKNSTLTLTACTVSGNQIQDSDGESCGGGMDVDNSTATITASTIENNTSASGGGIYSINSTLSLSENSVVDSNTASDGGGIYLSGGTITIDASGIDSNIGDQGGAINVNTAAHVTVTQSTLTNNIAGNSGGGLYIFGSSTVSLTETTVSTNTSNSGGGIYLFDNSNMTIEQSVIDNNIGEGGGGGIVVDTATLTFSNSTLVENQGPFNGGLSSSHSVVHLTNSTVAYNLSTGSNSIGGLDIEEGTALTLQNTIIAKNEDEVVGASTDDDCSLTGSPTVTSTDYNFVGINCGIVAQTNDFFGSVELPLDPLFDNFDDHGGATKTLSLLETSAAVDHGNCNVDSDQRGADRDVFCDIGAYEFGGCFNGDTPTLYFKDFDHDSYGDPLISKLACAPSANDVTNNTDCDDTTSAKSPGNIETVAMCGDDIDQDCSGADLDCNCGDGEINQISETCDNGVDNSDTLANACRTNCQPSSCGDGVKDTGEACDDGNNSNADSCLNTCEAASCGDGHVESGVEACDDGGDNSNSVANACRTNCQQSSCGDGVIDHGESCDDGSANSDTTADACRTDCTKPKCGDTVIDTDEECDDGQATDTCTSECKEVVVTPVKKNSGGGCSLQHEEVTSAQSVTLVLFSFLLMVIFQTKRLLILNKQTGEDNV